VRDWQQWIEARGGRASHRWSELSAALGRQLLTPQRWHPSVQVCIDQLRRSEEVAAVLFYGSCLFSETQTETSFPDFFLLVTDLSRYHSSRVHALLNQVLPPNVYYGDFPAADGHGRARCKFCVMAVDQFVRETSPRAHDIHHLGRFSKRFVVAYSADETTAQTVVEAALLAMLTLVPHTLALLPQRFTLEEFILKQLGLSYIGEQRIIEPDKIRGLLEGARDYYLGLYPALLALHALRFGAPTLDEDDRYHQPSVDPAQRRRTEDFLGRSRLRGMLRWPKYMLTVDNWVDYLLDKLERYHGVRVELSARQRRHPLLFGWPIYFEMRRRGLVK